MDIFSRDVAESPAVFEGGGNVRARKGEDTTRRDGAKSLGVVRTAGGEG